MRKYQGGHLDTHLEDYVDGTMPRASAQRAARHLVACLPCSRDVEAEREVLRRMRSVCVDPGRQANLVAHLLALEPETPPGLEASHRVTANSSGPLRVVSPAAPAQYDRRRRAPLVVLGLLGLGCASLVMASGGAPHRTAPGEVQTVQGTFSAGLADTVAAPAILTRADTNVRR